MSIYSLDMVQDDHVLHPSKGYYVHILIVMAFTILFFSVNAYHLISRFTLYFKNINPSMTKEYGNKSETEISTTDQVVSM